MGSSVRRNSIGRWFSVLCFVDAGRLTNVFPQIVDHDDGVLEVQMKKKNFKAVPGQVEYFNS